MDYPAYSEALFYDKAGNRARRLVGGEEELYQYDPCNRLMALTRGGVTTPFQYDNAGNLLRDDKAQYSYDAFNRTVKVETFDGNVQINRYDAEGLRHEMEENGRLVRFIFHKGEAVAEQEENSNVIRLIRGSELIARSSDSESARTYYHYASDEMGSTTHIVDENGNIQNCYAYDAWGKIEVKEESVPNRFTYYGQQIDPITQQYYLRARFYNPVIARFTQEDTYRGDGLNLYTYCANNPVYYVDPSGFDKSTGFDRAFEENYQRELAFAKEHGLIVRYDTPEAIQHNLSVVTGMPHGDRPDPQFYLPQQYIDQHLALFDGGVSKIVSWSPSGPIGKPGQRIFVLPSKLADDLIVKANGDISMLEKFLALEAGSLGVNPYRIDVLSPQKLYIPTGNEAGANDFWIAGGYTGGGVPEAVIDYIPTSDYTAYPIYGGK